MNTKPSAVLLMGPTASGKTSLALELSLHYDIEIISVDSALVYQDMDIGTAKPSALEQSVCPHHLINIISPLQAYSAADFYRDATQLIKDIQQRNKLPVLVGGTMLYYKALMDGLSDLPGANPDIRAQIEAEASVSGWPKMHEQLMQIDPITAQRLAPNDTQRINRALELYRITGLAMSTLQAQNQAKKPDLNLLNLALIPTDRKWLHQRIEQRFNIMLEAGFMEELKILRQKYPDLNANLPSMRCVGYRQAWEFLEGRIDYEQFVASGVAATRQLAKRQLTWLRSLPAHAIDCDLAQVKENTLQAIHQWQAI